MTTDATLQQVIDHSEANPLDILNKWWTGHMDNGAMYVLMQRALLAAAQRQTTLADPQAFAAMRKAMALPRERQLANEVIDAIKEKRRGKPLSMSDAHYDEIVALCKRMLEDGLRYHFATAKMLANGRSDAYFKNYEGGADLIELLEYLVDGNDGAL